MSRLWLNFSNVVKKKYIYLGLNLRRNLVFLGVLLTVVFIFLLRNSRTKTFHNPDFENLAELNYAVVIDAGSSGSRVFIYVWPPHTGNPKELLNIEPLKQIDGKPVYKKIEPGLSSFSVNPHLSTNYIYPLLEFAAKHVPIHLHKQTPLYILATAGMRLLSIPQQTAILDDLKSNIPKKFSFSFTDNSAEILSGKQEGVYQWIAINYVLRRFDHKSDAPLALIDTQPLSTNSLLFRTQTVGIMDMGGASMQIAFEVVSKVQLEEIQKTTEHNHAEFNLGCLEHGNDHHYHTYVTTYLGLGANEAFDLYNKHLLVAAKENVNEKFAGKTTLFPILDPCRPFDLVQRLNWTQSTMDDNNTSSFLYVKGTGDFDKCRANLQALLFNLTGCPGTHCFFSQLPTDFINSHFYGFSEFWYSLEDVLRIGGKYNFTVLQKAAKDFCGTRWSVLKDRYDRRLYPLADLNRFQTQCFKSSWIAVILHDGLGLSYDFSQLQSSPNAVNGKVVHWTLGAVLYRTRYFPLGDVQREKNQIVKSNFAHWFYLNYYWFAACFLLVCGAILLYLRRLRCLHPAPVANFNKPVSQTKVMLLESGFLIDRNLLG